MKCYQSQFPSIEDPWATAKKVAARARMNVSAIGGAFPGTSEGSEYHAMWPQVALPSVKHR